MLTFNLIFIRFQLDLTSITKKEFFFFLVFAKSLWNFLVLHFLHSINTVLSAVKTPNTVFQVELAR